MGFDVGARLRMIREKHGFSQRALAKQTGVTNGIISMIEQNRTSPSVGTLKKILDGIPISMAEFFAYEETQQRKNVYTADELVQVGGRGCSYLQVGHNLQGMAMQIIHQKMEAGADSGKEMLTHEAEEGGVVIRGKVELTVADQVYLLGPGDAYYFDSRLPHRFRNKGKEECELVSACAPPSF